MLCKGKAVVIIKNLICPLQIPSDLISLDPTAITKVQRKEEVDEEEKVCHVRGERSGGTMGRGGVYNQMVKGRAVALWWTIGVRWGLGWKVQEESMVEL